ncbi:MAG TPA: STAS domain-containing protein [bacterium]|nr:STAS domain-containing protein [bacterium]
MAISTNTETVTVLRLAGDISQGDMDALLQVTTDLILENKNKVVLNFRQVKHVSLNAISKLAERNLRFKALGGEIKLVGLIPYVANLFKLVGAFSRFDVVADEDEAVARFES